MKVTRRQLAAIGASGLLLLGAANVVFASGPQTQPPAKSAETGVEDPAKGPDLDDIQEGDQSGPDSAAAEADEAAEAKGAEAKGAEADGPGGHEDPAGEKVDHEFEGEE